MFKKIAALSIFDGLTKIVSYILLPIYLALMPKEEFGEFSYIAVAITYFSLFLSCNFYIPYIKYYCKTNNDKIKQEWTSTIFTLILTILIVIDFIFIVNKNTILEILRSYLNININTYLKYYLILIIINTTILGLYFYSLVVAINNVKLINLFICIKFFTIAFFSISALYFKNFSIDSVINRLAGMAIGDSLFIAMCFLILAKKNLYISYNKSVLKKACSIALPLIPTAIVGLLINLIDRKLLVEHHGLGVLADYNLAMQALAPIAMVMTAIQTIWAPNLFSISDSKLAYKKTQKLIIIVFIAMFLVSCLIAAFMLLTIKLKLISIDYSKVPLIIFFLSIGVILAQINHLIVNIFVKDGIVKYLLFLNVILLILNYALNVILVPRFSIFGAIFTLIFSYSTILTLSSVILWRRYRENI